LKQVFVIGEAPRYIQLFDPAQRTDVFGDSRLTISTPEERGVPKWTGTPEEATRMLRADPAAYQLTRGTTYTLKNTYGEPYTVSGLDVYRGLQRGDRFETEAEEHQRYLDENYGGPEEGGWWYTAGDLEHHDKVRSFYSLKQAQE